MSDRHGSHVLCCDGSGCDKARVPQTLWCDDHQPPDPHGIHYQAHAAPEAEVIEGGVRSMARELGVELEPADIAALTAFLKAKLGGKGCGDALAIATGEKLEAAPRAKGKAVK